MFLKFTHIVAWISSLLLFILLLSRIPIYKYITISLSICLLMDIWVLSCFLAVMNRLLSLYKSFGGLKFSIHLGKCLGMEILVNNTDVRSLYKKLTKSSPKIFFILFPQPAMYESSSYFTSFPILGIVSLFDFAIYWEQNVISVGLTGNCHGENRVYNSGLPCVSLDE